MADQQASEENEVPEHVRDAAELSNTDLRLKYPAEYNSWRNRKSEAKRFGQWAPEFEKWPDFLSLMGPMPSPGRTLDRIQNEDPYYGPGRCRWATKSEQANNRSTTRHVVRDGKSQPLTLASRDLGELPATVRQRLYRGTRPFARQEGSGKAVQPSFGKDPRQHRPWPSPKPSIPHEWEKMWLENGGILKCNRFEFLIGNLKRQLRLLSTQGLALYDKGSEDAETDEEFRRIQNESKRLEGILTDAESDYQFWLLAVRRHEANLNEQRALRNSNYLNKADEEG